MTYHPNESNPLGMLGLTRLGDGLEFYVLPNLILSINRLPACKDADGDEVPERTKLITSNDIRETVLVNETPHEIFARIDWLNKRQVDAVTAIVESEEKP